jgi:predicted enzyme related to lactoylglutathione lyase
VGRERTVDVREEIAMAHPVVHFEVSGSNLDKLQSFYSELFGWKTQKVPGDMPYAMVEKEGDGIGGGIGQAPDGNGHVTFYVGADDPQAVLDKAEQLGGKTIMPVTELPEVTIALFADPEGHVVGLAKGM